MDNRFSRFLRADGAVSALEYAILAGVIGVGVGGALIALAGSDTSVVGQFIERGANGVSSMLAILTP